VAVEKLEISEIRGNCGDRKRESRASIGEKSLLHVLTTVNKCYGLNSPVVPYNRQGVNAAKTLLLIPLFLCTGNALAQAGDNEPSAVIELGAAANRSLTESQSSFGPTVAVEVTPIANWLELEAGVTPLFRRHSTEWSIDLLFKKPWTLSDEMEFMLGIGPEWIHTNAYGIKMNSVAAEVAPDFMFWPSRKHRLGWYLEPSYEYKFGSGHEHSLAITGGLLIGIP
jgi:hypothetical protein